MFSGLKDNRKCFDHRRLHSRGFCFVNDRNCAPFFLRYCIFEFNDLDLIQFLIINLNATMSDHTPNGSNQRSSQPKGPWKHPKPPIYHPNPRLPPENTHLPPQTSLMHQICIYGPHTCGDSDFSIFRALVKAPPCGDKLMVTTLLLAPPHNRKLDITVVRVPMLKVILLFYAFLP